MIAGLAVLAVLVAEALAIHTVAELVAVAYPDRAAKDAVHPLVLVTVMLVAFSLPRLLVRTAGRSRTSTALSIGVTFVALYGAMRVAFGNDLALWDFRWAFDYLSGHGLDIRDTPRPVTGTLLIVLAWVRGTWRSLAGVEFETTPRQLAGPVGIVVAACILGLASDQADAIARAAAAFFAVALVALAFSQSALSGATIGDVRAGGITTTLLATTAGVAIVGVLASVGAFGAFGETVGAVIAAAIGVALLVTVGPIIIVGEWFVGLFDFDPSAIRLRDPAAGRDVPSDDEVAPDRSLWERSLLGLLRALGLGAGLVFVVGLILIFAGRWRRYRNADVGDVDVSSSGSLSDDLGSLLAGVFRRRGTRARSSANDALVRLYLRIVEAASERGFERAPSETPAEFAPALDRAFANRVTADVTRALEADVYGSAPPPGAAVAELERRWEQRSG